MTFPNLMLDARLRLHDVRKADGTMITLATEDGIRWSSTQLASLCKGAIHEMLRTLRGYVAKDKKTKGLNNFINNSLQTRIVPCEIAAGTGELTGITLSYYKIHRLQAPDLGIIYDEVDAETFFSKKWRTTDISDIDNCPIDERWFTPLMNPEGTALQVFTVPLPATKIENVSAILTVPIDEMLVVDSTVNMPFINLDDLILDFIEKEASYDEHNPQNAQAILQNIQLKLGLVQNELQESNR